MSSSEFHQSRFNAYRTLTCYFMTAGLMALILGAAGCFLAKNEKGCAKTGLYLLVGAGCTVVDGLSSILLGFALKNVMEGQKSACWMLVCLAWYQSVLLTKGIVLAMDTAVVYGENVKSCNYSFMERSYVIAQLVFFGLEAFCGTCYALSVGLEDAVEEALFHMRLWNDKAMDTEVVKEKLLV